MTTMLPTFAFIWPRLLWLLLLLPLLAVLYAWFEARRRGVAARYPALVLTGLGKAGGAGWRRHLPPALMLLALGALLLALGRPQAILKLPSNIETVILAMDMSGSMRAQDIKPSRLQAARQAAKIFLAEQPAGVSVGVVAVAGSAAVVQPPSRKKDDVATAIDRLQPQRGSALGGGLVIALKTLLPQSAIDAERFMNTGNATPLVPRGMPDDAPPADAGPVEPGSFKTGAIVLLSDGENNTGPDAVQAAKVAAEHGVRVYTVGIGTPEGTVLSVDGWSARVRLDEGVLKQVARTTGADYFRAEDAEGLKKVYRELSGRLAFGKSAMTEITALFAALGALLAACSGVLSLWWFGRVQ